MNRQRAKKNVSVRCGTCLLDVARVCESKKSVFRVLFEIQ